ncbi:YhcN/YlaJ family sporulation lipoprotein [Neobacillus drentensis]|uniref:YhcN/YlaJ family sporulation lipoprotein n=1 Tax=Neobacillus drentensis TaxID=220684 RepID=UPI001F174D23|nr:YhcN/YlaJ family sporulation lipoprotein [Neobacillus drentensis]ULT59737.1 YhcN/YlaJ family sporulation lipoprotein [Neobacillus drentensis]
MKAAYQLFVWTSLLFITACTQDQPVKESQMALMKTTNPTPLSTKGKKNNNRVEDIKRDVSSLPELYDVAVVKGDKDTLVVYKVKHMHRFKMKTIEKNLNKKLEKEHPKENFTVSSDYKIFLEAVRLNEKMKSGRLSHSKAEKRLEEIVKMTEDMK